MKFYTVKGLNNMLSSTPDVLILLAHLMEKDGKLGHETRARCDKAAELFVKYSGFPIIIMGWDYKDDTKLCISDAIANYLLTEKDIPRSFLYIDRTSRDTVGDAVFSKRDFGNITKMLLL